MLSSKYHIYIYTDRDTNTVSQPNNNSSTFYIFHLQQMANLTRKSVMQQLDRPDFHNACLHAIGHHR